MRERGHQLFKLWSVGGRAGDLLAEYLLAQYGGTIFLLGDKEARPAARFIVESLKDQCLDLTGKVSLLTLGALIERLALLITNDSGPAHLAYALHTPTVTLFKNSTAVQTNGPLQPGPFRSVSARESTSSASSDAAGDASEMQHISMSQVLSAIEGIHQEIRLRSMEG